MSNTNTGGPAFPAWEQDEYGSKFFNEGMTLRDYFASDAMKAMLAHPDSSTRAGPESYAKAAYTMADAMLKARAQ